MICKNRAFTFVIKKILTYQVKLYVQVCKSELNGIEIGSIVEIENDDQDGYFFAIVRSSNGILLKYVKKIYVLINT